MVKNFKFKLSLVFAILLIFAVVIAPVFSSESSSLTMNGLEFNIPSEYKYNSTLSSEVLQDDYQLFSGSDMEYMLNNLDVKAYSDSSGNSIIISTSTAKDGMMSQFTSLGYVSKEIGEKSGYVDSSLGDPVTYVYVENGQYVQIIAPQDSLEDIIV